MDNDDETDAANKIYLEMFWKKKRHWFGHFFGFRLRVGPWGEWQPALMVTVRFLARKTIWITLSSFLVLLKDTDQKFILAFGPFGLGKATAAISDQYQRGKKKRRDFFFLRRSTFPALVVACCSRAGFWLGIWFFLSGSVPFGSKFHKLNTLLLPPPFSKQRTHAKCHVLLGNMQRWFWIVLTWLNQSVQWYEMFIKWLERTTNWNKHNYLVWPWNQVSQIHSYKNITRKPAQRIWSFHSSGCIYGTVYRKCMT